METHCDFGICPKLSNGKPVCDVLPNCGCGEPAKIRAHYLRVLGMCKEQLWASIDRDSDLDLLLLYVLDRESLIEHGTTVYCSWLTTLGDEFLRIATEHWAQSERS